MLSRIVSTLASLCIGSALMSACGGEEKGLSGSQCDLIDCSYDKISCDRYDTPRAIVVHFRKTLEGGGFEWAARIALDLPGDAPVSGTRLEGQTFLDQVFLNRPDSIETWPEFDGRYCEITEGGDEIGKSMSGKCVFHFPKEGRILTAVFSCTLESAMPS